MTLFQASMIVLSLLNAAADFHVEKFFGMAAWGCVAVVSLMGRMDLLWLVAVIVAVAVDFLEGACRR